MVDIAKHPILRQAYELCLAIEECGFGEKLTDASVKASNLLQSLDQLLDHMKQAPLGTCALVEIPHTKRVSCRDWLEKKAVAEEGHDVSAGSLSDTVIEIDENGMAHLEGADVKSLRIVRDPGE